MKRVLLFFIFTVLSITGFAHDFLVDGIYYIKNTDGENTVSVTNYNDQIYSYYEGDVIIPPTVEYEGITYNVTAIRQFAFCRSSELTSVTIPEGVIRIGTYAFGLCPKLTTISIPSSVTEMGSGVFNETPWLENQPDGVLYVGKICYMYKGEMPLNSNIEIKEGTVCIASEAFSGRDVMTSISIPEGVLYIGSSAFYGCSALTNVKLPNSIKRIGEYECVGAFESCTSLTTINIPTNIEKIESQSFMSCSSLTTITIPEGATYIGNGAFYGCTNLVSVKIPSTVTEIGGGCFGMCSSLTSIKLPENLTKIESSLFMACSGLTSVNIPQNVESIGSYAFSHCTSLNNIILPDEVVEIGERAFDNCKKLSSVNIPSKLEKIGYLAFYECYGLSSVKLSNLNNWCNMDFMDYRDNPIFYASRLFIGDEEASHLMIPDGITSINKFCFVNCRSIQSLNIPSSVTNIGENAFEECTNLKSVVLPEKLQIIRKGLLKNCYSLQSIEIPSTVEFIYQEAFSNCSSLYEVKALPVTPPFLFENSFSNYNITLKVPNDSREVYASTSPWNKFATITSLTGEDLEKKYCSIPTISYSNGNLTFTCDTEGAECVATISDADIKTHYGNEISLTATYTISVYATATGYENSDVATATLCWLNSEPKTEGMTNDITLSRGNAVLIQSHNGMLNISGVANGTNIVVYSVSGKMAGSTKAQGNISCVNTNLKKGEVAIIQVGNKSVKVVMQ